MIRRLKATLQRLRRLTEAYSSELMGSLNSNQAGSASLVCRLKATLQRLRRLTEAYSSELMGAYTARAVAMGKALGLDPDRYNGKLLAFLHSGLVLKQMVAYTVWAVAKENVAGCNREDEICTSGHLRCSF